MPSSIGSYSFEELSDIITHISQKDNSIGTLLFIHNTIESLLREIIAYEGLRTNFPVNKRQAKEIFRQTGMLSFHEINRTLLYMQPLSMSWYYSLKSFNAFRNKLTHSLFDLETNQQLSQESLHREITYGQEFIRKLHMIHLDIIEHCSNHI